MTGEKRFHDPIIVSIPGVKKRTYRKPDEILEWRNNEYKRWAEFWGQISNPAPSFTLPNLLGPAHNELNQIEQQANAFKNAPNEAHEQQAQRNLAAHMEQYSKRPLITTSPDMSEIVDLSETVPDVAAVKICQLVGHVVPQGQVTDMLRFSRAVIIAEQHDIDPKKALTSLRRSLKKLNEQWEADLKENDIEYHEVLHQLRRDKTRLKNVVLGLARNYKQIHQDHEERMSGMETAFSTEMQLRAAEKFWGHKRRINRRRENASRKVLLERGLPFIGAGLLFVYLFIGWALGFDKFTPGHVFAYLMPTILAIWPLRILANEMRTNKDMADDAEEREAMLMTFKALEYETRVKDEERIVILNALFRPHERGVEDGIPNPAWDAILKRIDDK